MSARSKNNFWRGHLKEPKSAHPAVRLIFEELNRRRMLLRELAEESKVPKKTISAWRESRRRPNVEALEKVLNAIGYRLTPVKL